MSKSSTNKPNKPLCYVALMRENRNKQCQQKTERQKTHHEVQTISQSAMSKRYTSPNPSRFSVSKQTNRFQALPPLFQPTNARKQSKEDISLLPHSPCPPKQSPQTPSAYPSPSPSPPPSSSRPTRGQRRPSYRVGTRPAGRTAPPALLEAAGRRAGGRGGWRQRSGRGGGRRWWCW